MKNKKHIDVLQSLKYFFSLKDWIERTLSIGAIHITLIVLYLFSFFLSLIPIIGPFLCCFAYLFIVVIAILYAVYILGYKYALIEAIKSKNNIENVKFFNNIDKNFKKGFKLILGNLFYAVPLVLIYIFTYSLMLLPYIILGIQSESSDFNTSFASSILLVTSLVSYIPLIIAWIYQLFLNYFIHPSLLYLFSQNGKIRDMFNISKCWEFIKANLLNLLVYFAISTAISMCTGFAILLSMLLCLLCIGIFLLPVVMILTVSYSLHVQAHMIGQLIKLNE